MLILENIWLRSMKPKSFYSMNISNINNVTNSYPTSKVSDFLGPQADTSFQKLIHTFSMSIFQRNAIIYNIMKLNCYVRNVTWGKQIFS